MSASYLSLTVYYVDSHSQNEIRNEIITIFVIADSNSLVFNNSAANNAGYWSNSGNVNNPII